MKRRRSFGPLVVLTILLSFACQVIPTPPPLQTTPQRWATPEELIATPLRPTPAPTRAFQPTLPPTPPPSGAPTDLAAFPAHLSQPFANLGLVDWSPAPLPPQAELSLPVAPASLANPEVVAGLTQRQRAQLYQQGFVILHTQEPQFMGVRERVSLRYGQPYYLTSDAAGYALYLSLAELQRSLEREELSPRLLALTQATLDEILGALPDVQGTSIEPDVRLAAAYLGTGVRLLDPQASLDPEIAAPVEAQVQQIQAGGGPQPVYLLPGVVEDFSLYRPAGYYAGEPSLAGYYQATQWFGRITFPLGETASGAAPSQAPLIITLALRAAQIDSLPGADPAEAVPAVEEWALLRETLTFFNGPDFIGGPAELASLMDQVYGPNATLLGLQDASNTQMLRRLASELPPPRMIPGLSIVPGGRQGLQDWRFLGQGFQFDNYILDTLSAPSQGAGWPADRSPSGLDVMAVLGSALASQTLSAQAGVELNTPAYTSLQNTLQRQEAPDWTSTRHRAWLHVLSASLASRDESFPQAMRSVPWAIKDLSSALGAWAELRREPLSLPPQNTTAPEANQASAPVSGPAPGYVEPDPAAFYRLSSLAKTAAEGLRQRGMQGMASAAKDSPNLDQLLQDVQDLGDRLQRLGDIASGELSSRPPTLDDYASIQAPLGPLENQAAQNPYRSQALPSPTGIAGLSLPGHPQAQVATGGVDRLYVVVPLSGTLAIAQGAIYTYYEFSPPRGRLLDESTWQQILLKQPPAPPAWAQGLYLAEGNPVDVLAFQVGDVLRLTQAAGKLNVRQSPDRFSKAIYQLSPGERLDLIAGPQLNGGLVWWQVRITAENATLEGWVPQDPAWYERVY